MLEPPIAYNEPPLLITMKGVFDGNKVDDNKRLRATEVLISTKG